MNREPGAIYIHSLKPNRWWLLFPGYLPHQWGRGQVSLYPAEQLQGRATDETSKHFCSNCAFLMWYGLLWNKNETPLFGSGFRRHRACFQSSHHNSLFSCLSSSLDRIHKLATGKNDNIHSRKMMIVWCDFYLLLTIKKQVIRLQMRHVQTFLFIFLRVL